MGYYSGNPPKVQKQYKDSGHTKYVYAQTEIGHSKVRVYSTKGRRWGLGRLGLPCLIILVQILVAPQCPTEVALAKLPRDTAWLHGCPRGPRKALKAMAFESSSKLYPCGMCKEQLRFFKMMGSFLPQHKLARGSLDTCDKYLRVCVDCEMKLRQEEWASWTEEGKGKIPSTLKPQRS